MAKTDGGAAFPTLTQVEKFLGNFVGTSGTRNTYVREHKLVEGMSLRDYFAGQALSAIAADPDVRGAEDVRAYVPVARMAYAIADAMLREREKQ